MSGKSTGYCSKQFLGTCDYLKVAQKEIAEYKLALSQRIRLLNEAEVKVEAANKLLDAFTYEMDMTEMADLLRNLRTALQIPRSDEQKLKETQIKEADEKCISYGGTGIDE